MDGARAAQRLAAAEFRSGQSQRVAQNPEQRSIGSNLHGMRLAVHGDSDGFHIFGPLACGRERERRELYFQTARNAIRLWLRICRIRANLDRKKVIRRMRRNRVKSLRRYYQTMKGAP